MDSILKHNGIIIDGNRRWAKKRGLSVFQGHWNGFKKVREISYYLFEKGVKSVTIYVFSIENWNRTPKEVSNLMKIIGLIAMSKRYARELKKRGIRLNIIGQRDRLPPFIRKKIEHLEKITQKNKNYTLNLGISYGGRAEILEGVRRIIKKGVPEDKVTEEMIGANLWLRDQPDPDIIIRTGGEIRLSNFLTWQSIYSELFFLKKYWPDFTKKDVDDILKRYSERQRNFGK